ncbi:hypothetical protein [Cytobacillus sp. NCCP-133]|uniref:hypothetical protein n=1 Tax=Cytobacillus sp. NCCP-133 TaxID=766848 RepID=UPI00223237A8|nr:hypothetical protein [Cytobacillus sp. NCCP-133]GLB61879.1 hypothetical protein NCCP133_40080 [Cytobacillus sp. NCCP-133]
MEREILKALGQINEKLDLHGLLLEEQGRTLKNQGETLREHSGLLKEQGETLKKQGETLKEHGETIKLQGITQKEHTGLLGALISGQEALKAEISEFRLQNAKEFGELKDRMETQEVSLEILEKETWNNKKEIRRIQKSMGMK